MGPVPAWVGTLTLICVADHETISGLEKRTSINEPDEASAFEKSTAALPDFAPNPVPVIVSKLLVGSSNVPAVTVVGENDEMTGASVELSD